MLEDVGIARAELEMPGRGASKRRWAAKSMPSVASLAMLIGITWTPSISPGEHAAGVAVDARDRVDAGRRGRVLHSLRHSPSGRQSASSRSTLSMLRSSTWFFIDDPEIVGRDVEVAVRRPDGAGVDRCRRFRLEPAVAALVVEEAHVAKVAVLAIAERGVGSLLPAQVIIGAAGVRVAGSAEHIVQIGRTETGAVCAADQQRLDRPELRAGIVGELADAVAGEIIMIVTAGARSTRASRKRARAIRRRAPSALRVP